MVQTLCPNEGWVYKFRDYEGTEPYLEEIEPNEPIDPENPPEPIYKTLASIDDSEGIVVFSSDEMDKDYE